VAYPTNMTAALTGATVSQLQRWRSRQSGFLLVPELQSAPRALYSFCDILALRTCVRLREFAALQKIRSAVGNHRELGDRSHLASYTIVADSAGDVQLLTSAEAINLSKPTEQKWLFALEMARVVEPFASRPGVLVPDLFRLRPRVVLDPEVQGGFPVITGTRVPYDLVAGLVADGIPAEEIAEYYPTVSAEDAHDALDFARYVDSYGPRRMPGRVNQLAVEDYESISETDYLLRSPANAARLVAAAEKMRHGRALISVITDEVRLR
jgi:uncharacterized protein (DUF433 family)